MLPKSVRPRLLLYLTRRITIANPIRDVHGLIILAFRLRGVRGTRNPVLDLLIIYM
jgi:hypothetical protein